MTITYYGVPLAHMKHYRELYREGAPYGLLMAQLVQTYRTRKVMYDNGNNHPPRLPNDRHILPE